MDSDQLSFEVAAIQAFKNAAAKAAPVLLEPIDDVEVVTPEESMGDVIGDLNKASRTGGGMRAIEMAPHREGLRPSCRDVWLRHKHQGTITSAVGFKAQ